MKKIDKLMAISRHPEYIKQCKRLQKLKGHPEWRNIWKSVLKEMSKMTEADIIKNVDVYKTCFQAHKAEVDKRRFAMAKFLQSMLKVWCNPLVEIYCKSQCIPYEIIKQSSFYKDPLVKLEVWVDPNKSIVENINDIKPAIQKIIKKSERQLEFDMWLVYDLHKLKKMSITDITKLLTEEQGTTFNNASLGAYRKQVERAYQRAIKYIQDVSPK